MCMGGGGGSRTEYVYQEPAKQPDPAPTPVNLSDVTNSTSADRYAAEQEKKRRGQRSNRLSVDRATILGSIGNAANAIRTTLG